MIYYFHHIETGRIVSLTGDWDQVVNTFARYVHQYDELPKDSWDAHAWDGSDVLDIDVSTPRFEFINGYNETNLPMEENLDFSSYPKDLTNKTKRRRGSYE